MKVLCHPKVGGAEVEATLDPMTNGWSMGLVFGEVFLASGVWVVTKTRVGVCLAIGAPNPMKGSLEVLCLFLRGREARGMVC